MEQAELDHLEQQTEALINRCQALLSENTTLKNRIEQLLENNKTFETQKQQYQIKLSNLLKKINHLEEQL